MSRAIDWEKFNRLRRRTRTGDSKLPRGVVGWRKTRPNYEARCSKCGGPVLPGQEAWYMRKDGKHCYMHIGHSPAGDSKPRA